MIRSSRRGFTLIELMIVIAIIGILAAVMVPNFTKARAEANLNACIQNEKNIVTACQMYIAKEGVPDSTLLGDGLFDLLTDDTGGKAPYIKTIPTCPAGGTYTAAIFGKDEPNEEFGECAAMCTGTVHSAVACDENCPCVDSHSKIYYSLPSVASYADK